MIVLVTGGRSYANEEKVNATLDAFHKSTAIKLLIEGGAVGADRLCRQWANKNKVPVRTVNAQWSLYRKMAGVIRNEAMAKMYHDVAIAFPGGRGTRDMVQRIKVKGSKLMMVV